MMKLNYLFSYIIYRYLYIYNYKIDWFVLSNHFAYTYYNEIELVCQLKNGLLFIDIPMISFIIKLYFMCFFSDKIGGRMNKKKTTVIYDFQHLANRVGKFAKLSFSSISTVPHHHLDFYEIIFITKGEFEHTLGSNTTVLPAGTVALFKPGVTHQLFTEPFQSTHFTLCVEKHSFERYIAKVFPEFDLNSFTDYISRPVGKEKMKYMEYLGTTFQGTVQTSNADELLFLCITDFMHKNEVLDCNTYITEIIHKLNTQLYMNMSVKDICDLYPYSQSLLLRQFKKLTGMTMVEYKAQQKMKYACQLLKETNMKVIEISNTLHYDSLSYFLHAFKKQYDMTPSEYRKQLTQS